jgi:hypothetical protein
MAPDPQPTYYQNLPDIDTRPKQTSTEQTEPLLPTASIDPETGRQVSWDPELDRLNQENTRAAQEQQYRDYQERPRE